MVVKRMPTKMWTAKNALIQVADASLITFNNSATLSGAFASQGYSIEAAAKNITITPPETSWEKQDFLGVDTNNFQNQLLEEKPVGVATITGTMIVGEDETIEDMMSGSVVSAPTGFTRRQIGTNNTSNATLAVVVTFWSNSLQKEVSIGIDGARFTKLGDNNITGADAHLEQGFTITSLAKDCYLEFRD